VHVLVPRALRTNPHLWEQLLAKDQLREAIYQYHVEMVMYVIILKLQRLKECLVQSLAVFLG